MVTLCKQIFSNAAEVIKEEGRRKRREWLDNECEEATLKKNFAYVTPDPDSPLSFLWTGPFRTPFPRMLPAAIFSPSTPLFEA
jgi:hypothetical protein